MEAAFLPGIFRIFSDDFRKNPLRKHGKLSNPPEKIREIPDRNTASSFLVFSVANRPLQRNVDVIILKVEKSFDLLTPDRRCVFHDLFSDI
jgi:hypothetical protein